MMLILKKVPPEKLLTENPALPKNMSYRSTGSYLKNHSSG